MPLEDLPVTSPRLADDAGTDAPAPDAPYVRVISRTAAVLVMPEPRPEPANAEAEGTGDVEVQDLSASQDGPDDAWEEAAPPATEETGPDAAVPPDAAPDAAQDAPVWLTESPDERRERLSDELIVRLDELCRLLLVREADARDLPLLDVLTALGQAQADGFARIEAALEAALGDALWAAQAGGRSGAAAAAPVTGGAGTDDPGAGRLAALEARLAAMEESIAEIGRGMAGLSDRLHAALTRPAEASGERNDRVLAALAEIGTQIRLLEARFAAAGRIPDPAVAGRSTADAAENLRVMLAELIATQQKRTAANGHA